ncbi:SET domain-containing protein [Maridesulfovibrio sp.]|uniref:SET domain-containing protein n=1 Tax=Maridesulfovibrio sp. TaxID=2795000 RepID=UPI002A18ADD2|nr:SET domain-containing protein [Maridesulfovibrio sp.]
MIHPDTEVRTVSAQIGNGVFATAPIKKGTIVVVRDKYDTCLSQDEYQHLPQPMKAAMETYMYHDRHGNLILSWDHARYMNHNCSSNTMLTAYNIEIAIRDINPGDEITTEYGLLNIQEPYDLCCNCPNCRERLRDDDIDRYGPIWDEQIRESLLMIYGTEQPLIGLLDRNTRNRLQQFCDGEAAYSSVMNLKWRLNQTGSSVKS